MISPVHMKDDHGIYVGVDIGGTKVAAGLVSQDGAVHSHVRTPMIAKGEAQAALGAVRQAIDAVLSSGDVALASILGIGICCPGPLDPNTGTVINPPNLPCWRNFPLAAEVSQIYDVPVKVDNDANAAALAEAIWGAGQGYHNVFCATLGTGIGTGIVFDGKIYHGRTGAAAEGGHVSIDHHGPVCGCGKRGCIEALAAGPAIARRAQLRLEENGRKSAILDIAHGNVETVTAEMVGQAYASGDAIARDILNETVGLLAFWLGNMVDLLEPDVMILGGGVATMLQPFFHEIHNQLADSCINNRCLEIPLVPARYGVDAGIAGGAALSSLSGAHRTESVIGLTTS